MNVSSQSSTRFIKCAFVFFILGFLFVSGCGERDTKVTVEPGNPPTFILSGRSTLEYLQVSGPDLEREAARERNRGDALPFSKVYWQVSPREKQGNELIDQLAPIKYGKVPDGFVQVYPENGASPPPLVEDSLYNVRLSANSAGGVNMFFTIRNGRIYAEGE